MTTSTDIHPLDGLHRLVGGGAAASRTSAARSPQPAVVGNDRSADLALLFAFLLGLGTRLQVKFIGYLPISEVAILLLFPLLSSQYSQARYRVRTGWLLPLLALWMIGAIVSDLYRETEWSLAARGLARIVTYMAAAPFFAWFFYRDMYRKLVCFMAGTVPSMILSAYILRGGVHEGRELVYGKAAITWKTHWSAVALLAAGFLAVYLYRRSRLLAYVSNAFIGGLNVALGSRSTGAISLIAVAACMAKNSLLAARAGRPTRGRLGRSLIVAAILLASAVGLLQVYSHFAGSGQFGREEQQKYQLESRHKWGVLGAGRGGQFMGGLFAVYESPLIGYGSWPQDKYFFYHRMCEFFDEKPDPSYYKKGYPLIPSHSHVIAAWMEHGILGTFFWMYALFLAGRAILMPIGDPARLQLWVVSAAAAILWNVLFSPISYRMEMAMTLVVFISQYRDWKQSRLHSPAVRASIPPAIASPLPGAA